MELPGTHALADWALWYATQGWPIFPCAGKRPITRHGFQDATTDLDQIRSWWSQWPTANIGHPVQAPRIVLDIDPRHGGEDTLYTLQQRHGPLPDTLTSHTGGGGLHLFFCTPQPVKNKADLGDGIDVQADGSYVILPPSIHPETGHPYHWDVVYGPDDITPQPAPAWLLTCLEAPAPPCQASEAAAVAGPIYEGQREKTFMRVAGAMRRQGSSPEAIRAALEIENQRCVPPLDAADLDRMAQSVGRYPPAPQLQVQPPAGWDAAGVHGAQITWNMSAEWRRKLITNKAGPIQNMSNIVRILSYHEYWQRPENVLWWNAVRGFPMCGQREITPSLMIDLGSWFGDEERMSITNPRLLEQCVIGCCKKQSRDLLQLWLESLPAWDGQPRLLTWLTDIVEVEADSQSYIQEVSRVIPVSMVARAREPGCQYRYVVILQGPEAIGKTSLVRALATKEWYQDLSMGLETKEAHMALQGTWVAEWSELHTMTRTEESRLKAFVTMREDSYIPKYSNFRQRTERRTIFIGTTNEESIFKGQHGNTRYLPLKLMNQIDLGRFEAMRDQLFSEAVAYYAMHPDTWSYLSPEAEETARDEREQRRISGIYEQPLHEWLEYGRFAETFYENNAPVQFLRDETSWQEIAKWFLKMDTPEKWKDRSLQMQIGTDLRALGWQVKQVWKAGRNTKVWRKTPF